MRRGFDFEGSPVHLRGQQGIFKPAILPEIPLSLRTAPPVEGRSAPYPDRIEHAGVIHYCYRGTDPDHRDHVGVRKAMERHVPLLYLFGIEEGRYSAEWPVYVVHDDRERLEFLVQVEPRSAIHRSGVVAEAGADAVRSNVTASVQKRVHPHQFRARVLRACSRRCAVCRLRHEERLDAARVLRDGHPRGDPVVPNGLSLCKLHHGAFDSNLLGVRPDLVVEVRADVLREEDGPVLIHGIQEAHGKAIVVPRNEPLRPDRERLAERFEEFRKAG
ncbi:MAG: HNH endonuclease [Planctomycetes bacterium]|nr:HNH endonuclease [Planctomycetota bacterium]